ARGDRLLVLALKRQGPAEKGMRFRGGMNGQRSSVVVDGFLEAPGHLRFIAALELLACVRRPLTVRHVSLLIVPQSGRAILRRMVRIFRAALVLCALAVTTACARPISFESATPNRPDRVEGRLTRPDGAGPFPALVLLHGCQGVSPQVHAWARWLADRGYVAFVVDSFGPRKEPADCKSDGTPDAPATTRFDDAIGALKYLQAQPFVIPERVASFGWSQGGVFAI